MKIHVVGGGGREHTLVWRLAKDGAELSCAPGNAGIAEIAHCFPEVSAGDIPGQIAVAKEIGANLVVVGPEDPLVAGIAGQLLEKGISVFGPSQAAAQIEGSKAWCKRLLRDNGIPTADFTIFTNPDAAKECLRNSEYPLVIKVDGLAAGKGVFVVFNQKAAFQAVDTILVEKKFGDAGNCIVVEEFLKGPECSVIVIADGERILPLPPARDYKRLFAGNYGPNTGGMGSFAPVDDLKGVLLQTILQEIVQKTVNALAKEGCHYRGALYAGLVLTNEGPKVLEFNCRFGDPEAQVQLPLVAGNFSEILQAAAEGSLDKAELTWTDQTAICVVLASYGYPWHYEMGYPIQLPAKGVLPEDKHLIFHSGTARNEKKELVTAGGRVLGSVGLSKRPNTAWHFAYQGAQKIDFPGKYFRQDIWGRNC